jgi:hypothetical protein
MSNMKTRELYRSPNGDRWLLARDNASGRVFVTHEANLPSGGHVSHIELAEFFGTSGNGPEKQALLRLIAGLVDEPLSAA